MKDKHEYFDKAVEFIKGKDGVSRRELQAHFELGYNSAGRLVDQLEDAGIIGNFDGRKTRKVLISNTLTHR